LAKGGVGTFEIDVGMVEQEDFEGTTIILIDNTSASINEMLHRYKLAIAKERLLRGLGSRT
jgi:tRNA 2-selenouridine synthase SelU